MSSPDSAKLCSSDLESQTLSATFDDDYKETLHHPVRITSVCSTLLSLMVLQVSAHANRIQNVKDTLR